MAGLEYIGNILLEDLCEKFNVPFKRVGSLRVVNDDNGVIKLDEMYDRAVRRGIDGVYLVEPDEIYEIEPNINTAIKKGLYSQNVAITAPYDLAIAYAEVASDNGVNFRLEEEVLTIQNITKGYIHSNFIVHVSFLSLYKSLYKASSLYNQKHSLLFFTPHSRCQIHDSCVFHYIPVQILSVFVLHPTSGSLEPQSVQLHIRHRVQTDYSLQQYPCLLNGF